jgi:hypothetical protein
VHGNAVNELRLQVARRDQGVFPLDPTCNGPCDRDDEGGPTVEIAGVANAGRHRIYPQLRDYLRYQALDTFTRVAGKHELKAGFDFGVQQALKSTLPLTHGGRFIFTALPAVPGLLPAPVTATQAFALGLPGAYVHGYGNPTAKLHATDLSVFAQDAWRPRPDVTVKLGCATRRRSGPIPPSTCPASDRTRSLHDSNNRRAAARRWHGRREEVPPRRCTAPTACSSTGR